MVLSSKRLKWKLGGCTKGIMADIGWKNMYFEFDAPKDLEQPDAIDFTIKIESDVQIDTTALFLIY